MNWLRSVLLASSAHGAASTSTRMRGSGWSARAVATATSSPRVQLSLADCDAADAYQQFVLDGNNAFLVSGLCVTYDAPTTNLYADTCGVPGTGTQTFTPRADGTLFNAPTGLCWDVQYYGNTSGSLLGLYECTNEAWGIFVYNSTSSRITNTQLTTLCVSSAPAPLPLPTPEQLAWLDNDMSLMISYDLITQMPDEPNGQHFCYWAGGDSGFPLPPATTFNPTALNASNWVAAASAVGAGYTLLVASHCSGFLQWQSNVTLPDGSLYSYGVRQASTWRGGNGDVVSDYVEASRAADIGFGFYLTWNYNYYLQRGPRGQWPGPAAPGQVQVTDAEYAAIMEATIEEDRKSVV